MSDDKQEILRAWITEQADQARAILDKFGADFAADPIRAMDGCGGAIDAAASLAVFRSVLHDLEHGADVAAVERDALAKVIDGAQHPPQSTSPSANLFKVYKTRAWGSLANRIKWRL